MWGSLIQSQELFLCYVECCVFAYGELVETVMSVFIFNCSWNYTTGKNYSLID
jgi:hypothetical protein